MPTEPQPPPTDEQLFEKFSRENHCAQVSYEQLERELYDCRQQVGGAFMVLKDYQKSCSPDLPTAVRNALELCNKNLRTENARLRDQLSDLRARPHLIKPQPDADDLTNSAEGLSPFGMALKILALENENTALKARLTGVAERLDWLRNEHDPAWRGTVYKLARLALGQEIGGSDGK